MKTLSTVFFLFLVASPCLGIRIIDGNTIASFNVVNYGAKGDGQTDDSTEFLNAWKDVCGAINGTPTLIIPPERTFLLQPTSFKGPCTSKSINVQLQGSLVAPESIETWKWADNDTTRWIRFMDIDGLVINGGGVIDGQGAAWWKNSSLTRPTALGFHDCQSFRFTNLKVMNSPGSHMSVNGCNSSFISDVHITAPGSSPNTDGIDTSQSSYLIIQNSIIESGDDCIAINSGTSFINITGISCGPGHGISIGSLGVNGEYATVEEIHVKNCTFIRTTNGARIKTWEGGSGYARKITYEDITLIEVRNPIIINQQYGYHLDISSAVKVSDITFNNVNGTSTVEDAIRLSCDPLTSCTNIVLSEIDIISSVPGKKTYANCSNAHGTSSSCNPEIPCLLK